MVSRYFSCIDNAAIANRCNTKIGLLYPAAYKADIPQENQTVVHMIPINTMSYYNKYLVLVLHNMCSALKDSEAVIILYNRTDERPH
jgi:hypothetical protein